MTGEQAVFCYAIRDLLWLTLVVAVGMGWLTERSNGKKLTDNYNQLRCKIEWCPPDMHIVFDGDGSFYRERKPER